MQLAHYMLARADPAATAHGAQFDGRLYHDGGAVRDFHYGILAEMLDDADPPQGWGTCTDPRPAPLWATLVARARDERADRWS